MYDLVDRNAYGSIFFELLDEIETGKHGERFENDVFSMMPYLWNCDCETEDCPCSKPNFHYKPTDFKMWWYKYPLRGAYANGIASRQWFRKIIKDCVKSLCQENQQKTI